MSKIFNLVLSETAFVQVEDQTILYQELQDDTEMFQVKTSTAACNENIVEVDEDEW